MSLIDEAKAVREGENLDLDSLARYFKEIMPSLKGEISLRQFPGGASNLTYQVSILDKSFILRRPPIGKIAKNAHDMVREAKVMEALKPVYPYVPHIISICEDASYLDCQFYVMEKLKGIIPRQEMPKELLLNEEKTRALCLNVIDKLVELHKVDIESSGLSNIGKGQGYVNRQINGWSERFIKAKTDDVCSFDNVMDWLKINMPEDKGTCLIHNDFRLDNVVLNADNPLEVIGILDWEMATIGDPLMDLGNSLAYWVQADDDMIFQSMRRQPTHIPGMLTRREVVDYYLDKSGLTVDSFLFYEIYGLFRLAVIIQQIYYRYYNGQTKDKRFAGFGGAVNYLEQRCLSMIKKEQQK